MVHLDKQLIARANALKNPANAAQIHSLVSSYEAAVELYNHHWGVHVKYHDEYERALRAYITWAEKVGPAAARTGEKPNDTKAGSIDSLPSPRKSEAPPPQTLGKNSVDKGATGAPARRFDHAKTDSAAIRPRHAGGRETGLIAGARDLLGKGDVEGFVQMCLDAERAGAEAAALLNDYRDMLGENTIRGGSRD